LVVSVGIIGYQNHANRLISLIETNPKSKIKYIFHPKKKFNDKRCTNCFTDLLSCDAIIISSPNDTHYQYIKKLETFSGYIFCEKPPVSNINELNKLKKLKINKKRKIFFNFNYRFSELDKLLQKYSNSKQLGQIVKIEIIASQGLAFKKEYIGSWRSNGTKNKHTLLDTVSIHYLDLIIKNFGTAKNQFYFPKIISKNGTSYDTSHLLFEYKNFNISIMNSYATPFLGELSVIGTNGYLMIKNNTLEIRSPRNTFDKNNLFITPPIILRKKFNMQQDHSTSLKKSIEFFISHVTQKIPFKNELFETSIGTTDLLLKIKKDVKKNE